jgi:hypothetical protein
MLLREGQDSSVSIATVLLAGRSGDRNPVGARFSTHVQTSPGAQTSSYTMGTGRGVALTTNPHPTPRLKQETLRLHVCVCLCVCGRPTCP